MLVNVQFLRFVAALLVVLFHVSDHLVAGGHDTGILFGAGRLTGFAGVDVFFVISGFIMAWTTVDSAGAAAALDFAKRRAARIYSGYWPFCAIYAVTYLVFDPARLGRVDIPGSLLLWPTPIDQLLITVSWTLIFEVFFYALFALLILALGASRDRVLPPLFLALTAWFLYSQFVRQAYAPENITAINVYENYWAFPFLLQFLAGAIAARWLHGRREGMAWPLILSGVGLWALAGYANAVVFDARLLQGHLVMWRVLAFGLPSLLLLCGLVRLEFAGVTLLPRLSILLGGASYAIYLSHMVILYVGQRLGMIKALAGIDDLLARAIYLLLAAFIVTVSVAHYRWIERPLHDRFRRWLRLPGAAGG